MVNFDTTVVILHADHGEQIPNFLLDWLSKYKRARKLYRKLAKIWWRKREEILPFLQIGHGYHVYDYLVKVPLVFTGNKIPKGKIITNQVGQVDIFPTIIDLVGIEQKIPYHGRSLVPLINGEKIEEHPLYMEACGSALFEENWLVGIRTPEWKFVFAPKNKKRRPELYNLKDDPREIKNLISERMEVTQRLEKELLKIQSVVNLEKMKLGEIKMSEEEEKEIENRLKELGYL
ncbi:MAG: sulfatase/phosphatase domain-containing protein [bacterium]